MSTILISIKKEYLDKIFAGTKKYEFRKIIPKKEISKLIFYETAPTKLVLGEAEVDSVILDVPKNLWNNTETYQGIAKSDFDKYYQNTDIGIAFGLTNIKKYPKPKTLKELGVKAVPQGYVYLKQ